MTNDGASVLLAARALCVSARPLPLSLRASARASLLESRGTAAACRKKNLQTTTKTEAAVCSPINGKNEISLFLYSWMRDILGAYVSRARSMQSRAFVLFNCRVARGWVGARAGRSEAFPNRGRVKGFTGRACRKPRNKTALCFCGRGEGRGVVVDARGHLRPHVSL